MTENSTAGERLRELRKHSGMTLEQVATRVGMTASKVSRIETGVVSVAMKDLLKFATIYKVPPGDLASLSTHKRSDIYSTSVRAVQHGAAEVPREVVIPFVATINQMALRMDRVLAGLLQLYMGCSDEIRRVINSGDPHAMEAMYVAWGEKIVADAVAAAATPESLLRRVEPQKRLPIHKARASSVPSTRSRPS